MKKNEIVIIALLVVLAVAIACRLAHGISQSQQSYYNAGFEAGQAEVGK